MSWWLLSILTAVLKRVTMKGVTVSDSSSQVYWTTEDVWRHDRRPVWSRPTIRVGEKVLVTGPTLRPDGVLYTDAQFGGYTNIVYRGAFFNIPSRCLTDLPPGEGPTHELDVAKSAMHS